MLSKQGSMWRSRAVGVVVGILALCGSAAADTIYVATCGDDAWSGANPECQEPDGPKATIQAAIDAAVDDDEIAVLPGTYNEINFIGKAVRLYSTDGPEVTIIDGEDRFGSVVTCSRGEGPDTVLEGYHDHGGHWRLHDGVFCRRDDKSQQQPDGDELHFQRQHGVVPLFDRRDAQHQQQPDGD